MLKLIVCDIDDTLLSMQETDIPLRTKRAIRKAREMGYLFTLATGRIYLTARRRVEELGVDLPVIAANGADIRMDHQTIEENPIDAAVQADLIREAHALKLQKFLFCRDEVLALPRDRNEELFRKWTNGLVGDFPVRFVDSLDELITQSSGRTGKILLWAKDAKVHGKAMDAFQKYAADVDVSCGEPLNLEITKRGICKGWALERLAEILDMDLDEVMVIGDSGNDVSMFEKAGFSVAVANAMPEATRACDVVTVSCSEGGVGKAIEDYILPQGRIQF